MSGEKFYTISQYLATCTSLKERVDAIDLLITQHIAKAADAVGNADLQEYRLEDGQMLVRTTYRNSNDVFEGIAVLEKMKQMYLNQLNGRVKVFRGGRGLDYFN